MADKCKQQQSDRDEYEHVYSVFRGRFHPLVKQLALDEHRRDEGFAGITTIRPSTPMYGKACTRRSLALLRSVKTRDTT